MYSKIILRMMDINKGNMEFINHTLKVYAIAMTIAEIEIEDMPKRKTAVIAAILHDIGILQSLKKYDSSAGKYQEIEGPPIAKVILEELGYSEDVIKRVCFLISKHHTYHEIDDIDHRVLIEADFLVNLDEGRFDESTILSAKDKVFETSTGIGLLDKIYLID